MLILNIFAHLAANTKNLITRFIHIDKKILLLAVFGLLFFAQCKKKSGGNETQSLEDSLSAKYGKGSEVIQQMSKDIANQPDNPELYYKRARQWALEGIPVKALMDIRHAVDMEPANPLYQLTLGDIGFMNDSVSLALKAYNKAVELKPDYSEAYVKLGELQMILYQYSESNATFDKLLDFDGSNAKAFYYKGRNFAGMKDTARAMEQYKKAVSLDNDYYDAYVQLGNLYFKKGGPKNLELAEDYFTNAIRIKELSTEALYARALTYYDLSLYKSDALAKALKDNERIMAIDPDDYRPYLNVGLINLNLNQFEEAINNFDKVILMNPESAKAYYYRALAFEGKNDYKSAVADYQKVVALDTTYTSAKQAIAELKKKIR